MILSWGIFTSFQLTSCLSILFFVGPRLIRSPQITANNLNFCYAMVIAASSLKFMFTEFNSPEPVKATRFASFFFSIIHFELFCAKMEERKKLFCCARWLWLLLMLNEPWNKIQTTEPMPMPTTPFNVSFTSANFPRAVTYHILLFFLSLSTIINSNWDMTRSYYTHDICARVPGIGFSLWARLPANAKIINWKW